MSDTFSKIKKIVADKLEVKEADIQLNSKLVDDLGADSLDVIELVMQLEDEFGITISDDDAEKIATVQDIVNFIENQ
jgi:acyl carrier protein